MNPTKFIVLFSVLSVLTIGYIFSNSFQCSEESNNKSMVVTETVQKVIKSDDVEPEKLNSRVRKTAHAVEFSVLGLFLGFLSVSMMYKFNRKFISFPLLIALLSAATDEFIQRFNDRSSEVKDVFIDFGGAIFGLIIACLIAETAIKKLRQNKKI